MNDDVVLEMTERKNPIIISKAVTDSFSSPFKKTIVVVFRTCSFLQFSHTLSYIIFLIRERERERESERERERERERDELCVFSFLKRISKCAVEKKISKDLICISCCGFQNSLKKNV